MKCGNSYGISPSKENSVKNWYVAVKFHPTILSVALSYLEKLEYGHFSSKLVSFDYFCGFCGYVVYQTANICDLVLIFVYLIDDKLRVE